MRMGAVSISALDVICDFFLGKTYVNAPFVLRSLYSYGSRGISLSFKSSHISLASFNSECTSLTLPKVESWIVVSITN